jgi:hypothetical protein
VRHNELAGTPHVSLPSDIIQFIGPSSVPAVVFATVFGLFELGERLASEKAKDALSKWLLTFDIQKSKVLPDGTKELFDRIFGERHFSLKCFVRSALFSIGAIAFVSIVYLLINPHPSEVFFVPTPIIVSDPGEHQYTPEEISEIYAGFNWTIFALWLPWSIVIDYISLFKTRLILGLLGRIHRGTTIVAIAISAVDYIAYWNIFFVSTAFVFPFANLFYSISGNPISETWANWKQSIWFATKTFLEYIGSNPFTFLHLSLVNLPVILFWSGFAPSLWLWLYVFALFITRLLLRSERIVNWLRWGLDVEKNPFRSIGAVAATLAFIGSVAIILVSMEVSRISTAL